MTREDEAVARAKRVDALTSALLAHQEEGKALNDLQIVLRADDRDLLREARERQRASEEAAFRKRMRRWNVAFGIVLYLLLMAIWILALLPRHFAHH